MRESDIHDRIKRQKHHHTPASAEAPTHDEQTHSSHSVDEENRNSHSRKNDLEKKERKTAMRYRPALNLVGLAAVIIVGVLSCVGNARAFPVRSIRANIRAFDTIYSKVNLIDRTIQDNEGAQSRAIKAIVVMDKAVDIDVIESLKPANANRANANAIDIVDLAVRNSGRININLDAINLNAQSPDLDRAKSINSRIADIAIVFGIDAISSLDRTGREAFSPMA